MAPAGTRPQYMYTLMGCPSAALGSRPRGSLPPHNSYKNLRMCLERKATRMRTCPRTVTVSPIGRKRTRYIPSSWHTPLPPLNRGHEGPLTPTPIYKKRKNVASKELPAPRGAHGPQNRHRVPARSHTHSVHPIQLVHPFAALA